MQKLEIKERNPEVRLGRSNRVLSGRDAGQDKRSLPLIYQRERVS